MVNADSTPTPNLDDLHQSTFGVPAMRLLRDLLEKAHTTDESGYLVAVLEACSNIALLNDIRAHGGDRLRQLESVIGELNTMSAHSHSVMRRHIYNGTSILDVDDKPFPQTPCAEPLPSGMSKG